MSIVTLKNKTATQYNNMSVGQKQFSLNGGFRNQGWVGQTMLSRSLPRTPMKGNVPKGNGGCCGKYLKKGIIQSAVSSLNDPKVVKNSVINNMGMINTQYRWARRPYPFSVFKRGVEEQEEYIKSLQKKRLACAENVVKNIKSGIPSKGCDGLLNHSKPGICSVVTKKALKTMNQSDYIQKLYDNCFDGKIKMINANNTPLSGGCLSKK